MQWSERKRSGVKGSRSTEEQHSPAPTPSRAVYGFLLYLLSNFMLIFYLVWAVVPDPVLASLGLDFLPQKYWAVALPLFLALAFVLAVVVVYPSLGRLRDPGRRQADFATDKHTISRESVADIDGGGGGGVPPMYDMPFDSLLPCHLGGSKIS